MRSGEASRSFLRILPGLALCAAAAAAQAEGSDKAVAIYEICGACHGPAAIGIESLAAPPLAGREPWYLLRQLHDFSSGARGGKGDTEADEMRQILATLPAESDWQAVVAYVSAMPKSPGQGASISAARPPQGDRTRGERLFATCGACHGSRAEGNQALDAPALAGLPGWYLDRQLRKFRSGLRGGAAADVPGARMRAAAVVLASDADVAAVSAYIDAMTRAQGPTAPAPAPEAKATRP